MNPNSSALNIAYPGKMPKLLDSNWEAPYTPASKRIIARLGTGYWKQMQQLGLFSIYRQKLIGTAA